VPHPFALFVANGWGSPALNRAFPSGAWSDS